MKEIPVYQHTGTYAREHGELEQFRNSFRANIACKEAIEATIREHYRNNCLGSEAPKQVVDQFGYARVFHVLANTVKQNIQALCAADGGHRLHPLDVGGAAGDPGQGQTE